MRSFASRSILVLAVSLGLVAGQAAADTPRPAGEPTVEKDITYTTRDGAALKLDLYRPAGPGPFPLIVWVHGGGWRAGTKADYHHLALGFAKNVGWAGASIDYRLAPAHKFPAQIQDVKTAIRFLRSKAAHFNIDPERVAVVGGSAGGHLALLAGFVGPEQGLEGDGYEGQSSRVNAVVNYFGPTDLVNVVVDDEAFRKLIPIGIDKILEDVVGTADRKSAAMKRFSPITYVRPGLPPVFTIQGSDDPLVPKRQAEDLHAALKKAGVPEQLYVVEKGGHGDWSAEEHLKVAVMVSKFLAKHVGPDPKK